jgi:hypothetical protein
MIRVKMITVIIKQSLMYVNFRLLHLQHINHQCLLQWFIILDKMMSNAKTRVSDNSNYAQILII